MNDAQDGVELRVHGIGDHDYLSALGTPATTRLDVRHEVDVADPPVVPRHPLRLLNWSRTTRSKLHLLWYVAFPFTLINVAGNMKADESPSPAARLGNRLLGIGVSATSIIATVCTTIWLIAVGETVFKYIPIGAWEGSTAGPLIAVLSSTVLAAAIATRRRLRPESSVSRGQTWAHVIIVLLVEVWLVCGRPAQWEWTSWRWATPPSPLHWVTPPSPWPTVAAPSGPRLDVLTATVVVSVAIAVTFAILLMAAQALANARSRRAGSPAGGGRSDLPPFGDSSPAVRATVVHSFAGAGLVLVVAVLTLHGFAALVRMATDWMGGYLGGNLSHPDTLKYHHRTVMPYDNPDLRVDFRADLVPFFLVALIVCLVVAFLVRGWTVRPRGESSVNLSCAAKRAIWVHRVVDSLGRLLPGALLLAGILGSLATWGLMAHKDTLTHGFQWRVALAGLHLSALTVVALLVAGEPKVLKNLISRIADVAGFWPVEHHPLGGVSYRASVLVGLSAAIRTYPSPVVLVGHSQGSVLSAWFLSVPYDQLESELARGSRLPDGEISRSGRGDPRSGKTVHLVTCGSPLRSLYGTFFPSHFAAAFYQGVDVRAETWKNFWRETDPIATELSERVVSNASLPDPPDPRSRLRKHGDYWLERDQIDWIHAKVSCPTP